MNEYWAKRVADAQLAISEKNEKQINRQLRKYYQSVAKKVIEDFDKTYNKLLATQKEGKEIMPADLYKFDAYWKLQAQTRRELTKLGEKQIATLTKLFELNYFEVYYSFALEGHKAFTTIDSASVTQMINSIWVADGKTFSQRVWDNINRLVTTLNEGLIHCVAAGKKTTDLKNILQERFGVSYHRANTLVRTELCHIQTQAAKQRYQDYGIQEVEVLVDKDKRTCEECEELIGKHFPINGTPPLPAHPNERCCLVPVIAV